jgi:DNA mismatch endonuclease (patch repair protein)
MTDTFDKATRSQVMSKIRSKNTKPELIIRKGLHARGFRYRLHSTKLPGKPDIMLPKYKALILVNGCFWHGHNCHIFRWPTTRKEYWQAKILANARRDCENISHYTEMGWKTLVIWECAIRGKTRLSLESVLDLAVHWIVHEKCNREILGKTK